MACVPSMATPVPPLDPNAINTFIVQTANVAATQTVAAIPTSTITVVPRDTFTPEPTYTPVGTIIFPTSTPISRVQYFRIKHDTQLAEFNYQSRTAAPDWPVDLWGLQTPEIAWLYVGPKVGIGRNTTTVDGNWEILIDALNDHNPKKLSYLKADNSGLFDGNGFPQLESLSMGGNIITLDEVKNDWGRVHTIDYYNPGALKDFNYLTRPDLIHKFVVVGWNRSSKTTYITNPPHGDIYWPLVSSRAVWIQMDHLEAFPTLPKVVTAKKTQEIRTKPSLDGLPTGNSLAEGTSANIVEYYPSGSNVWGRIAGGGWIALLLYEKGAPQYLTSWAMVTLPPPAPSK